jgi:hypothetical protein
MELRNLSVIKNITNILSHNEKLCKLPENFTKIFSRSDGNCFFYSLINGIYIIRNEILSVPEIKKELFNTLKNDKDNLFELSFIDDKTVHTSNGLENFSNIKEYENLMKKNYSWGDYLMYLIARKLFYEKYALNLSLIVININNETNEFLSCTRDNEKPIDQIDLILLQNADHFDILINNKYIIGNIKRVNDFGKLKKRKSKKLFQRLFTTE